MQLYIRNHTDGFDTSPFRVRDDSHIPPVSWMTDNQSGYTDTNSIICVCRYSGDDSSRRTQAMDSYTILVNIADTRYNDERQCSRTVLLLKCHRIMTRESISQTTVA